MTFRTLAAVAGLAIATLAGASSANAAPLGAMDGIAGTQSLVTKVHGCHRSCERGPVLGWHRHGVACRPIACWPRAVRPHRCWIGRYGVRHCRW